MSNRYIVYNDRQCVEVRRLPQGKLPTACMSGMQMSMMLSTQGQWGCSNRYRRLQPALQGSGPDDLCAVIYDVAARKRARVLPRPVFTVSPDGALATSVDFIRLQKVRKGKCTAACLADLQACESHVQPQRKRGRSVSKAAHWSHMLLWEAQYVSLASEWCKLASLTLMSTNRNLACAQVSVTSLRRRHSTGTPQTNALATTASGSSTSPQARGLAFRRVAIAVR